ncbi:MAG: hypothetical protein RL398_1049 [Planctomycetota bacterium]
MIPLRDSIPSSRPPVVTYGLIAACGVVWGLQLGNPDGALVDALAMVPAEVLGHAPYGPRAAVPAWATLLTCTFLHGGWLHFLGNMLFLWIFGDNVEDRFGRLPFLLFYLLAGVAASAAHLWTSPESTVPTVGASGAIAGVMGAYLLLYPQSRVQMLVVWGFYVDLIVLPAKFFLGYWFVLQLLQGSIEFGREGGGVAWWAHIGGFVLGALCALGLKASHRLRPAPAEIALLRRRVGRSKGRGW